MFSQPPPPRSSLYISLFIPFFVCLFVSFGFCLFCFVVLLLFETGSCDTTLASLVLPTLNSSLKLTEVRLPRVTQALGLKATMAGYPFLLLQTIH